MALDKDQLQNDLATAFQSAKDNSWTIEQVCAAIATAIDTYVTAGEIRGLTVDLTTGSQNNQVKVQ